ncbi:hypothetical protein [Cypionkella sinensis]|uniref:Uncharacterized protein n=1 Tax=Cypionkella sinensis TaxID=1756043 RepID=A0ABV7IVM3_9RHOB
MQGHTAAIIADHTVKQAVSRSPLPLALDNLNREAAHVFDQNDPQRDGNRPDLANLQWRNALICLNKPLQNSTGNQTVTMGHIGPRKRNNARITFQMAIRQFWQLAVKTRG